CSSDGTNDYSTSIAAGGAGGSATIGVQEGENVSCTFTNLQQTYTLGLTKSDNLNPAMYDHVGQVVTYTLTATNNGNATLHNVTVTDSPALANFSCSPAVPVASLAPAGTITCTGTHTISQGDLDAGSFLNTACTD